MARTDPKNLVITTPGRQYNSPEPDATVVNMGADDFLHQSVNQVKEYIQQFGTLKKLTIVGHGNTGIVDADPNNDKLASFFSIPSFLRELKKVQDQTGIKIADRIVFDACSTMKGLSPDGVQIFRDAAKSLGSEIVGATTTVYYDNHPADKTPITDTHENGLFATFEPDGTVHRDRRSTTIYDKVQENIETAAKSGSGDVLDKLLVGPAFEIYTGARTLLSGDKQLTDLKNSEKEGSQWFACHDGKNQEEGAACQLEINSQLPKPRADSRRSAELKSTVSPISVDNTKTESSPHPTALQSALNATFTP